MPLYSRGDRRPTRFERALMGIRERLRRRTTQEVVVDDRQYRSVFVCDNATEAFRALCLWIKEEGTMLWLDGALEAGDRFLDIGANIGISTIAAAQRVGPTGRVVAVEPHKPNVLSLMRNATRNGLSDRIDVLSVPLSERQGIATFNYRDITASSTGSQLGSTRIATSKKQFAPVGSEICVTVSIDELIEAGAFQPPHLVKIDVDGIELRILEGMTRLLTGPDRPRSVQVELNIGEMDEIVAFLDGVGYRLDHRHLTMAGKRKQAAGRDLSLIPHNAVFVPA